MVEKLTLINTKTDCRLSHILKVRKIYFFFGSFKIADKRPILKMAACSYGQFLILL